MATSRKAKSGCWTCKSRKIGCDRSIPYCNNCIRTGRLCNGYGIRLHWPKCGGRHYSNLSCQDKEKHDHSIVGYKSSGEPHFLNTTYEDISLDVETCPAASGDAVRYIQFYNSIPESLENGAESTWVSENKRLFSYYHEVLSRMITTIDDEKNGFRRLVLPSALLGTSLSSEALRQSILSLSAGHLGGPNSAVRHKIRAIRFLLNSLKQNETDHAAQFSSCMMLCVCDVFDGADGSWHHHLKAAQAICSNKLSNTNPFQASWLAYHRTLGEFSHPCDKRERKVPVLPNMGAENTIIIGALGCSMQVLESISWINKISDWAISKAITGADVLPFANDLLQQLERLSQVPSITEDTMSGRIDEERINRTAELYRLSTIIYLHTTAFGTLSKSREIKTIVQESLDIMEKLEICTSPWPVFITACETTGDEQRIRVLDVLENMQRNRRIRNIEIIRDIVEAVWKWSDLNSHQDVKARVDWRKVIDGRYQIPSFI